MFLWRYIDELPNQWREVNRRREFPNHCVLKYKQFTNTVGMACLEGQISQSRVPYKYVQWEILSPLCCHLAFLKTMYNAISLVPPRFWINIMLNTCIPQWGPYFTYTHPFIGQAEITQQPCPNWPSQRGMVATAATIVSVPYPLLRSPHLTWCPPLQEHHMSVSGQKSLIQVQNWNLNNFWGTIGLVLLMATRGICPIFTQHSSGFVFCLQLSKVSFQCMYRYQSLCLWKEQLKVSTHWHRKVVAVITFSISETRDSASDSLYPYTCVLWSLTGVHKLFYYLAVRHALIRCLPMC